MKQILTKLSLFLLLVSGLTMVSSAQAVATPGTATISSDMVIQIDPAATLMENYTFSIAAIPFASEEAATRFFSMSRDNILNYTLDYEKKSVTVKLGLQYTEPRGWGVVEYNEYFGILAERYRTTLAIVNE